MSVQFRPGLPLNNVMDIELIYESIASKQMAAKFAQVLINHIKADGSKALYFDNDKELQINVTPTIECAKILAASGILRTNVDINTHQFSEQEAEYIDGEFSEALNAYGKEVIALVKKTYNR